MGPVMLISRKLLVSSCDENKGEDITEVGGLEREF